MDPPQLKFITKVYHPNIDNTTGLICLDLLKMPPQGKWRPIINLSALLTAVQQLLSDPNPHDPLDAAIVGSTTLARIVLISFSSRPKSILAIEPCSWKMPRNGLKNMLWYVFYPIIN